MQRCACSVEGGTSALYRPLLHALLMGRCSRSYGIELDAVKCDKARAFCHLVINTLCNKGKRTDRCRLSFGIPSLVLTKCTTGVVPSLFTEIVPGIIHAPVEQVCARASVNRPRARPGTSCSGVLPNCAEHRYPI
jgi:hypothetical protein